MADRDTTDLLARGDAGHTTIQCKTILSCYKDLATKIADSDELNNLVRLLKENGLLTGAELSCAEQYIATAGTEATEEARKEACLKAAGRIVNAVHREVDRSSGKMNIFLVILIQLGLRESAIKLLEKGDGKLS